ncbi:hypothetical protein EUX98_g2446 [Antrodiella citrinella]|uniref:Major facilitator superfamily (MFS) profile domain-containing protein n=1 Tax=Antrodiella citrinella TaxID=2447956 RepID=A0A4S4MZ19_9APHY|nr:hypothetical protein EUX98_g2446 [Antrodiella citrinella]
MTWLVAAREPVVQGLGAGGLQSIPNIIVSDLVPLSERGTYQGFIGLTWAFASAIAPLVSGALASNGQWRWFFYLNLPLCGIALVLILLFLHLPTPPGTLQEKLNRIDWIGNMIFVASTTTLVIGLTWGGITYPWVSVHVLAPLLLGTCGLGLFMFYEAKFATNPIVPISLLRNRTSVSGYIQTFINPVVNIAILYYIPVYYQACKDASPIGSSVDMLTLSLVLAPCAVLGGVSVAKFQRFRPQLWIAWCLYIIGMGAFTVVRADTAKAVSIGLNVIIAVGGGILLSVVYFPILSPLSVSENAAALSFHGFCRLFAGVWGVSIGAAILQNQLASRLPPQFLETVLNGSSYDSSNVNLVFSVIPLIHTLPEPLKEEVRAAFGDSLAVVWQVMTGILVIGLIASVLMRDVPLHSNVDKKWGVRELEKDGGGKDAERQGEGSDNSVKTESITSLVV